MRWLCVLVVLLLPTQELWARQAFSPASLKLSVLNHLDPTFRSMTEKLYRPYYPGDVLNSGVRGKKISKNRYYRAEITRTDLFPWRYVGYIEAQRKRGEYGTCTGTMISRHIVITAAHCVYSSEYGYLQNIHFYPSRNKSKLPLGRFRVTDTFYLETMKAQFDNNQDMAFMLLEKSPYSIAQWQRQPKIPIGLVDKQHFNNKKGAPLSVIAAGYPTRDNNDPRAGTLMLSGSTTYRIPTIRGKDNQFEHQGHSEEGTSGGPVFAIDPVYDQFALIGVTSAQRVWSSGESWAVAIAINPKTRGKIQEAIKFFEPDYQ